MSVKLRKRVTTCGQTGIHCKQKNGTVKERQKKVKQKIIIIKRAAIKTQIKNELSTKAKKSITFLVAARKRSPPNEVIVVWGAGIP